MAQKTLTLNTTQKTALKECEPYRRLKGLLESKARYEKLLEQNEDEIATAQRDFETLQRQVLRDAGETVAESDPVEVVEEKGADGKKTGVWSVKHGKD